MKKLNGFGLTLWHVESGIVISFWSLRLTHIIRVLQERLKNRYVVVYTGRAYSGLGKPDLSISEMMISRGVPSKKLRSGCVSIRGNSFLAAARRLRRDIRSGRFEFVDATHEPQCKIFDGFTLRDIQFISRNSPSVALAKIPVEIGSTFNCSLRDDDMGAVAVRKRDEAWFTVGCLEEMFRREFGRLKIGLEPTPNRFRPMLRAIWLRFRQALIRNGITVIRKDIRLVKCTLIATCWLGYPERDRHFDKMFLLKYSLDRGKWWIGPITRSQYIYSGCKLSTGWRLPSGPHPPVQ
jgi:hypothetical protein